MAHPTTTRRARSAAGGVAAVMAAVALAGCGGNDRTYQPPPPQTAETTTAPVGRPAGPLSATGAGAMLITMGPDDVRASFGDPDARARRGGLEQWVYRVGGGTLRVYFDRRGLASTYATDAPSLATERDGVRVGDRWKPWYRKLSEALAKSREGNRPHAPGGDGNWVLSVAEPGGYPALTFVIRGGVVREIDGGYPPPGAGGR